MPKYRFDQRPNTQIQFKPANLADRITSNPFSCIVGPNNSGKSFVLRDLVLRVGEAASYLGPARYNNFNTLAPYSPNPNRRRDWYRQLKQRMEKETQNFDNSPFNVQQAIAELDDERRDHLFEIVQKVLGVELSLELAIPENQMSQRYISADGHNFSFSSSGVRLVVSIITSLLDTEYTHFFVDEPELGISPKAQGSLVDFIFRKGNRDKYFPHMQCLVFATHSSLFLDRQQIHNNFVISKSGDMISVSPLASLADFNRIHFFLLGNRLESLFLPSLILFVEGPCEEIYLSKVFETRYPGVGLSLINATNDSEMKRYAHMISQLFPELQHSPYKDRILPILDSVHGNDVVDALRKKGIPMNRIIKWSKNGIEHYYPEDILSEIFGGTGPMSIIGDEVTRCDTTYRKLELAKKVTARITPETKYSEEMETKLFRIVEAQS